MLANEEKENLKKWGYPGKGTSIKQMLNFTIQECEIIYGTDFFRFSLEWGETFKRWECWVYRHNHSMPIIAKSHNSPQHALYQVLEQIEPKMGVK